MKIVVKIGSALISKGDRINSAWLKGKVGEVAALQREGHRIVIVSSGAVAAGMEIEGLTSRPKETLKLQLLSGEGQVKLMKHYKDYFKEHGILVAQLLLTHHNFSRRSEQDAFKMIMEAYLSQGTVPVVNENDLINKEELEYKQSFTDNDILAALVTLTLKADMLLILTDVDGLYGKDPKSNSDAELVQEVGRIDQRIKRMASREANPLGLGGMASKIRAAEMVTAAGIPAIVAGGGLRLGDILARRVRATFFKPAPQAPPARG